MKTLKFNEFLGQSLNEGKGYSEAKKLIANLRSKVYPKLSDDELDEFKKEMADHLDLKLPDYLK